MLKDAIIVNNPCDTETQCDTIIIYRKDLGGHFSSIVYECMKNDESAYYGYVYFSADRSDGNYVNDIPTVFEHVKNIILINDYINDKYHFTMGFPEILEECKNTKTVTAKEITAIMKRYARACFKKEPGVTVPKLIVLSTVKDRPLFSDQDDKYFLTIAKYSYPEGKIEHWENMRNFFTKASENVMPINSGNEQLNSWLQEKLKPFVMEEYTDGYRNFVASASIVQKPPFHMVKQTMRVDPPTKKQAEDQQDFDERIDIVTLVDRAKAQEKDRVAIIRGEGGMGKTTQLINYCYTKQHPDGQNSTYDPKGDISVFIPVYQTMEFKSFFSPLFELIAKTLGYHTTQYRNCFGIERNEDYTAGQAHVYIPERIKSPLNQHSYVFCIDGLDEISHIRINDNENLLDTVLRDIDKLLEIGCTVVLTTRSMNIIPSDLRNRGRALRQNAAMMGLEDMLNEIPREFRPQPGSKLAKLLRTPFYFTMYYQTVCDGKNGTGGEETSSADTQNLKGNLQNLYHSDNRRFYHHNNPTTAGELIWNYWMRHVAKYRQDGGEISSSELKNIYFLMYLLPKIAARMDEGGYVWSYDIQNYMDELRTVPWSWLPFWFPENITPYKKTETFSPENYNLEEFNVFVTRSFPLMRNDQKDDRGNVRYKFIHSFMQEAFKALEVVNEIRFIIALNPDDCANGNGINEKAFPLLAKGPLPDNIRRLAGQIAGEKNGLPYISSEEDRWCTDNCANNNVIRRALNCLRGKRGGCIPTVVYNLYAILKAVRKTDSGVSDLSGIDFSDLDMTKCSLNQVIFSHVMGYGKPQTEPADDSVDPAVAFGVREKGLFANFHDAFFDPVVSFGEGHEMRIFKQSIVAMLEVSEELLLTADNSGCVVLWDLAYAVPIHVLKLCEKPKNCRVSNFVRDEQGGIYIACDSCLFTLRLENRELIQEDRQPLKTRSVKHLAYKNGRIVYYPQESPMDGILLNGEYEHGSFDGKWWNDAVVSHDGSVAYGLCMTETFSESSASDIKYFNSLQRRKWIPNEGWVFDGVLLSEADLQKLTGFRLFEHGMLLLRKDGTKLMLCLYGERKQYHSQEKNAYVPKKGSRVLEIDLTKRRDQDDWATVYSLSLLNSHEHIHAACLGTSRNYFSSSLSIYRMDVDRETQLIRKGVGTLTKAQFLHDTRYFYTLTQLPVCIQFFDTDTFKCVKQVLLNDVPFIDNATLGYRFAENLAFNQPGGDGLANHPERLRILLWKNNGEMYETHVRGEEWHKDLEKGTTVVKPCVYSYYDEDNSFSLHHQGQTVVPQYLDNRESFRTPLNVHPEWMFAGCDFSGAKFIGGHMPEGLEKYMAYVGTAPEPSQSERSVTVSQYLNDDAYDMEIEYDDDY